MVDAGTNAVVRGVTMKKDEQYEISKPDLSLAEPEKPVRKGKKNQTGGKI
jgi:hypothetical protein